MHLTPIIQQIRASRVVFTSEVCRGTTIVRQALNVRRIVLKIAVVAMHPMLFGFDDLITSLKMFKNLLPKYGSPRADLNTSRLKDLTP